MKQSIITEFYNYEPFYFFKLKPFTQWYKTSNQFTYTYKVPQFGGNVAYIENTVSFCCTEQWMMWKKALLFNDYNSANKILLSDDPAKIQHLGRCVKNFDQKVWDEQKISIVYKGNMLKFSQNPDWAKSIKQVLYNKQYFVEANPYDKVWGIGLNIQEAKAGKVWKGENLLGIVLTNVAMELIKKDQLIYQEDVNFASIPVIKSLQIYLQSLGIDTTLPLNVDLIENQFHDILVEFLDDHYGKGEYKNHN